MKKMFSLLLVLLLLISLCSCGKKGPDLPIYNGIAYEQKDDNTYIIPGIVGSDFDAYLDLLRENGFTFTPSEFFATEEEAMAMDLWQGSKDDLSINVWLMFKLSGEQYLEVNILD